MSVTFQQRELASGLTVIAEVDPSAHSAAAGFFVRTGARDEPGRLMGVSHFLEHMMFKGTEAISVDELNRRFDELGAKNNAYTSSEVTCFYAHVLPERLDEAVDLLGAMMRPALRQRDFDTEKNVILEEIAMYQDNPFWVLYESVVAAHYRDHALGHRVLGTDETITALERDEMMAYFNDRYSADNTVVSLAGNIDFDRCCDTVERVCSAWERTGASRDATPPPSGADALDLTDDGVHRGYYLSVADGPSAQDDARYAASLASQLLGAPDNSRLHWALVDSGIAEEAQSGFDAHDGVGSVFVYASGEPNRLDEIASVIIRETDGLADAVNEDELDRLRTKIAPAATLSGERPADRMQRIGRVWATTGEYRSLEEELDRIGAVTVRDVLTYIDAARSAARTEGRLRPA
ncbi:MAG: hypothetical protein CMJ31_00725 [Phycisphaerae bacterium]|nr:hypothetical protein [Phycisphaerae bacterium]